MPVARWADNGEYQRGPRRGEPKDPFIVRGASEEHLVTEMDSFNLVGNFYVIDDSGEDIVTEDISGIANFRDVLRVGLFELSGGSNLEMEFTLQGLDGEVVTESNLFNAPIDIVIAPTPMADGGGDSRWKWNDKDSLTW